MPTNFHFCHPSSPRLSRINGVRIRSQYGQSLCDLTLSCSPQSPSGTVQVPPALFTSKHELEPQDSESYYDLLLPSLAHPHIHLDKAFLLSHPNYPDYVIKDGDFSEAFTKTTEAKKKYTPEDLLERGRWVISESVNAGVTAMRAFVEVDVTVGFKCLDAAIQLKKEFEEVCHVQICAYAQDPIFTTENGEANKKLLKEAIGRQEVDVIGMTPYVEETREGMRQNVLWATNVALREKKMLDFHMDYNLNVDTQPLVRYVIEMLEFTEWTRYQVPEKQNVLIGHCTRLTLYTNQEWKELAFDIEDLGLKNKIIFVGLPTSDTYMQGRPPQSAADDAVTGARPRATLMIPQLIKEYNIQAVIGINNIGNMYTPHGSCDPLSLISSCVGLYQAGTVKDTTLLYECVSTRAKRAMGLPSTDMDLGILADTPSDFILIPGEPETGRDGDHDGAKEEPGGSDGTTALGSTISRVKRRPRLKLSDVVLDPPGVEQRKVIYRGSLVK
jgi:hypothetical protein